MTSELAGASVGAPALTGRHVVARIRRLLLISLLAAALYPAFMNASKGYCAGGVNAEGGFIDSAGRSIDEAPLCVQLQLGPSPLVYVGIAVLVWLALGRVMKASDDAAALKILDRSAILVGCLVLVAVVVSQVWFALTPVDTLTSGSFSVMSPFPFGLIDVSTSRLTVP